MDLYLRMSRQEGVRPDVVTFNALMSNCVRSNKTGGHPAWEQVLEVRRRNCTQYLQSSVLLCLVPMAQYTAVEAPANRWGAVAIRLQPSMGSGRYERIGMNRPLLYLSLRVREPSCICIPTCHVEPV